MAGTDAPDAAGAPQPLSGWRAAARDLVQMIRFHSRLSVPALPFETEPHAPPDFRRAPRMLPLAGLAIALPAGAVLAAGGALGLPPLAAAGLALAALALATGALHEDGLADSIDGLAGGRTPERRLEIMRDSRIGSFGATALGLALLIRASCLAALLTALGGPAAAAVLLAAAAVSRALMLLPLALLPPARADGAAAAVGRPTAATLAIACGVAFVVSAIGLAAAGTYMIGAAAGMLVGAGFALAMTEWARQGVGGHTGDIAGACQQVGEIGFYVGVIAVMNGAVA